MEYSAEVRQRFFAPSRVGDISPDAASVLTGTAEDRSLGVWIRFQVQHRDASIQRVRFRAFGCPEALAAADLVASRLEGEPLEALTGLDLDEIAARIGLPREQHGLLLRLEDALNACYSQAQRGRAKE